MTSKFKPGELFRYNRFYYFTLNQASGVFYYDMDLYASKRKPIGLILKKYSNFKYKVYLDGKIGLLDVYGMDEI